MHFNELKSMGLNSIGLLNAKLQFTLIINALVFACSQVEFLNTQDAIHGIIGIGLKLMIAEFQASREDDATNLNHVEDTDEDYYIHQND